MAEDRKIAHRKCRLCGSEAEHKVYHVKEMFFGTGEEFTYFLCDKCQCMQIMEIPEDLGKFYGNGYYSFGKPDIREPESQRESKQGYSMSGAGRVNGWRKSMSRDISICLAVILSLKRILLMNHAYI